jgi:hypothetical protein
MSFINSVRKLTALKNIFLLIKKIKPRSLVSLEDLIPAYCYPVNSYYNEGYIEKSLPIYFSKHEKKNPTRKIIFTDKDLLPLIESSETNKKKHKNKNRHHVHRRTDKDKDLVIPIQIPETIKSKDINEDINKDSNLIIPTEIIKNENEINIPVEKNVDNTIVPLIEAPIATLPSKNYYFCTTAGKEYILKVLALHQSLKNLTKDFNLWICCMDELTYSTLSKLKLYNVYLLRLKTIEDNELLSVKSSRKINEYCWTLKAPLIKYVLDTYKVPHVIYCDSDLYFFSDPKVIYDEWSNNDVFLCPQRDIQWVEDTYGKYQAGLIGFKNTDNAMKCLNFWRSKCIEWCYSNPEPAMDRFGDQKYLDKFPNLFQGIKISYNLGVNAAPWNCVYNPNNNYNIYEKDDYTYINTDKLVVFHFATINIYNYSEFDLWSFNYVPIRRTIKDKIYLPYLNTIRKCIDKVKSVEYNNLSLLFSQKPLSEAQTYYRYLPSKFRIKADDDTKYFCTIITAKYLIRGLAFYNSLKTHARDFHLWIYCVDETSYHILNKMKLENVTLLPLAVLEDADIKRCKKSRKINEFCWTLKAPLVQYVLSNYDVDYVIYCDADIFFFEDPSIVLKNWVGYYFYICTQRDDPEFERIHGRLQAGFIGFKKEKESLRILEWWRQKCIEWCLDEPQPELERWGDQKYLDKVPLQFVGIMIENNLGINAAPWNIVLNNHFMVHNLNGKVYVANDMLIFYHFGSMVFYNESEYDLWKLKPTDFNDSVINNIYVPYLNAVKDALKEAAPYLKDNLKNMFTDKDEKPPINYFNIDEYGEKH